MKRDKDFDCVEMKWEIQRRLHEEFAGMSPEEARHATRNRIEQDPVLGPFLREVKNAEPRTARKET